MGINTGNNIIKGINVGSTVIARAFLGTQKIYDQLDYPTLDLNFAATKTLDSKITFTRASSGTYFDSNGVMQLASANTPRFDHNPNTKESSGLLIEEQRTNLCLRSEDFGTTWTNGNSSEQINVVVSPAGTLTGDKLVEDTSLAVHFIGQSPVTIAANTNHTFSCYIKAAERTRVVLRFAKNGTPFTNNNVTFDLVAGTATQGASGFTTTNTPTITPVGNGWYRCSMGGIIDASSTDGSIQIRLADASGNTSYTGDGFSGIYIWGAQLEAGAFPTSYIPTVGSQVTRSADAASMTGANFSSWYNLGEGAFFAAYSRNSDKAAGNQIPIIVGDGTNANFIAITDGVNGSADRVLIVANGASQMNTGSINYIANQLILRSIGYKVDDCATSANGAAVVTDTSALIPVVNQLTIGYAPYFTSSRINGHIRRIAYYPRRLANTELQLLTS